MQFEERLSSHHLPHHLNLNFSEGFLDDNECLVFMGLPYPIHKPLKYNGDDIIEKYEPFTLFNHLSSLSRSFKSVKSCIMNQPMDKNYVTITEDILNYSNKPKREFKFVGDYNPFYAMGLLDSFNCNNGCYLIRRDCENNLRVNNIEKPKISKKVVMTEDLEEKITGISVCDTDRAVLLLQLESQVNILQINDLHEPVDIKWTKKFKRKLLDSKYHDEKIGVVLSNTKYQLYDIHTSKKLSLDDNDSRSIIRTEFIDPHNIACLSDDCLQIMDQRSKDCRVFKPDLDDCRGLCSMKIDDNCFYLASRHYFLRGDVRFFKDEEFCAHLMENFPCYMDFLKANGKSFLCLSGQDYTGKVLFTGSNVINQLPLQLPSIKDTKIQCQLREDILLKNQLDSRLNKPILGVKLLHCAKAHVALYTVNSVGEIHKQKISESGDSDEADPVKCFYNWTEKLPETTVPLRLTNVVNLDDVRLQLNRRTKTDKLVKFKAKNRKVQMLVGHYSNKYDKSNLGTLLSNFASIWEDEEEENEDREEPMDLVPEVAPVDKVASWIKSSYFSD